MKKQNKLQSIFILLIVLLISGCDLHDDGLQYYQVYNKTEENISLRVYFNHSLYYTDTLLIISKKQLSDIYTHYETGAGISQAMILMSSDSIDLLVNDSLLKRRYKSSDSRLNKTFYSKEFYDSTYVSNDRKTVYVYTVLPEDFD